MKSVTICVRGPADSVPTIISTSEILRELGYSVICVCEAVGTVTREALEACATRIIELTPNWSGSPKSTLGKAFSYLSFRQRAWKAIAEQCPSDTVLWVVRIDTARALGKQLVRRRYILDVKELHDNYPRYQKRLRFYTRHATKVVAREATRAAIMRVWYNLAETPCVLPNRMNTHPRTRMLPISNDAVQQHLQAIFGNYKILLYQGLLPPGRNLVPIARAISRFDDYRFVLMGRDSHGMVAKIKEACPSCVHLPFVPPPAHLEITSNAHLGVAAYDYDCINAICCAPNKIWEYAGFGIPMLCQNIPGLNNTVGQSGAGLCVELGDQDEIVDSIRRLDANYEQFSRSALSFYESVSPRDIVSRLLSDINYETSTKPMRLAS